MKKEEVISKVSGKIRVIRAEAGYTQDKMAEIIGISKKTLVQIEKGRIHASWPTVVTVCALFRDSETVQHMLGDAPLEILETIAHEGSNYRKERTLGGRIWWKEIERSKGYILQQNLVSQHYRILDEQHFRLFSSFDEQESMDRFRELVKAGHALRK